MAFQPVDINQASLEQLSLLPGVGKKLAANILSYRKKHGPLVKAEQLLAIEGMSPNKLANIKTQAVFKVPKSQSLIITPTPKITIEKKPIIGLSILEKKVLLHYGLNEDVDLSLSRRVKKAAWLPQLSALMNLDQGDITTKKAGTNSDAWQKRGGQDFGIGIKATFDLEKLIFNKDELEVAKLSLKRLEKREEVIHKLHKNYFHYLQLADTASKPLEPELSHSISFEMAEVSALLDAMSGGEFSRFYTFSE